MAHLHELLAVDRDLENTTKYVVEEAVISFTKKTDHFTGGVKTYEFFDEKRQQEAAGLEEKKELTTTVKAKLDYVKEFLVRHLDALAQKEHTNKADRKSAVEGKSLD